MVSIKDVVNYFKTLFVKNALSDVQITLPRHSILYPEIYLLLIQLEDNSFFAKNKESFDEMNHWERRIFILSTKIWEGNSGFIWGSRFLQEGLDQIVFKKAMQSRF